MKFLVIGLGSMGRRRIRNLQYLGAGEVIGFDLRSDRCEEATRRYGVKTFPGLEDALKKNPDVVIICTPADRHDQYAVKAGQLGKHVFTESSFLPAGMDDLVALGKRTDIVAVPSFTMPHHPSVKLMKSLIGQAEVGRILCFTYHLGAYLPDWHPWEDYQEVYYSTKETPGCKEMVAFELTWLTWLLGPAKSVSALKGKLSALETGGADDVYQIVIELESGILGSILFDVVSRPSIREAKLVGEKGTIIWNSLEGWVKVFDGEKQAWQEYPEELGMVEPGYSVRTHEEMYIEEMGDFLRAIRGEQTYPYSYEDEKRIVDLVGAVDQSADEGRAVQVG